MKNDRPRLEGFGDGAATNHDAVVLLQTHAFTEADSREDGEERKVRAIGFPFFVFFGGFLVRFFWWEHVGKLVGFKMFEILSLRVLMGQWLSISNRKTPRELW